MIIMLDGVNFVRSGKRSFFKAQMHGGLPMGRD